MEQQNRNENEVILSVKDLVVKFSLRGQELTSAFWSRRSA